MRQRVMVVDDHRIVQQGLEALLETSKDYEVVAVAGDGRAALAAAATRRIDIAIVDVMMPELNGVDTTRQLLARRPNIRIVGLSMHREQSFVVDMLTAGARGYLLKDCAFDELIDALDTVRTGNVYLGSGIDLDQAVESWDQAGETSSALDHSNPLSNREREVLKLLTQGKRTRDIAAALNLGVKTIESHRRNCQTKLGIKTVAGLTRYAIRNGLTSLNS